MVGRPQHQSYVPKLTHSVLELRIFSLYVKETVTFVITTALYKDAATQRVFNERNINYIWDL